MAYIRMYTPLVHDDVITDPYLDNESYLADPH